MRRAGFACGMGVLLALVARTSVGAESAPAPSVAPAVALALAPRLSSAPAANEYWDVTAWLDSGERVVARLLVTNQGPGERTAAAVGHVLLADGSRLHFQWGRRRDEWALGPDGRSLKIGKAKLELAGPTLVASVESEKHGISFRLEIERTSDPVAIRTLDPRYTIAVALPAPARGRIQDRAVTGTAAVTHTVLDVAEGQLVGRRLELFGRADNLALYAVDVTGTDGARRDAVLVARGGRLVTGSGAASATFGDERAPGSETRYPLPASWHMHDDALDLRATIARTLLRVDPLDVLPQPFHLLLALGGEPQRVWGEASVALTLGAGAAVDPAAPPPTLRGLVAATFARPGE